jgi:hypothetical protein
LARLKSRVIAIPEGIDRFDQVLETVSSLRPVRVRTIEQWQKYRAFMVAGLLLYVVMIWATSPAVVIPLSLVMGSVIMWVFFWTRRNPYLSINQKRIAWIYWLFFLMCILKLLVAVDGTNHVNAPAMIGKMLAYMLGFSPCALLTAGGCVGGACPLFGTGGAMRLDTAWPPLPFRPYAYMVCCLTYSSRT